MPNGICTYLMHDKWKWSLSFQREVTKQNKQKNEAKRSFSGGFNYFCSPCSRWKAIQKDEAIPDRLYPRFHGQTSLWMFSFLFFLPSFELGNLKEPLDSKFTNSAPALSAGPHNGNCTARSNSKAQEVKVLISESPHWPWTVSHRCLHWIAMVPKGPFWICCVIWPLVHEELSPEAFCLIYHNNLAACLADQ